MKHAAARQMREIGKFAGNRFEADASMHRIEARHRSEQSGSVRMRRPSQHFCRRSQFQHAAGVKDAHGVANPVDESQVVRDEQHRQPAAESQFVQQIEYRRLDGDIERRRGLVEDHEVWVADQRGRDQRTLLHAAAQLVRIRARYGFGMLQSHFRQCGNGPVTRGGFAHPAMEHQRFSHLQPDRQRGIERREWILENNADAIAAERPPLRGRKRRKIATREANHAGVHVRLGRQQAHHRQRDRAFARARFADERQRFACPDRETDVAQRVQMAFACCVADAQCRHVEHARSIGRHGGHAPRRRRMRGSSASRSPSPIRLTAITVTHIAIPGVSVIHGARSTKARASLIIRPQSAVGG